ncbi:MAG: hypothetical protein B6241_06940 [Spirochaetaceae bacterium 4572_59]|nr:MAG: hypothetical protein B6241_06940 [Spirochaetaceae bacterium 4572_59]
MMKKILIFLTFTILLSSCSSMPKDEQDLTVSIIKTKSAMQLERGNNEYRWNNYDSALALYSKALSSSSSVDWQPGVIRSLVQISRTLDQLKQAEKSRQYALAARGFRESIENKALNILTQNRIAEWYYFQDDINKSLTLIDQAILQGKNLESEEAGETWRIKASILKKKENYEAALSAIDEAVNLDKKGLFLGELASDYYIKSSLLSLSGKYPEAVVSMEAALEKDKFIENSSGIAMDLYGLGKIHEKNGNSDKALEYYNRLYLFYLGSNNTIPDFLLDAINSLTNKENWLAEIEWPLS